MDWVTVDAVVEFTQAALVIYVFDAHTCQPVWHGSSRRSLEAPAAGDASIAEAVHAILRAFPPAARAPAVL
jgi:hypothetical protein